MDKRIKCPQCQSKVFRIVDTDEDLKVSCNKCGATYLGFKKKTAEPAQPELALKS